MRHVHDVLCGRRISDNRPTARARFAGTLPRLSLTLPSRPLPSPAARPCTFPMLPEALPAAFSCHRGLFRDTSTCANDTNYWRGSLQAVHGARASASGEIRRYAPVLWPRRSFPDRTGGRALGRCNACQSGKCSGVSGVRIEQGIPGRHGAWIRTRRLKAAAAGRKRYADGTATEAGSLAESQDSNRPREA
jgi:hypothetical protein